MRAVYRLTCHASWLARATLPWLSAHLRSSLNRRRSESASDARARSSATSRSSGESCPCGSIDDGSESSVRAVSMLYAFVGVGDAAFARACVVRSCDDAVDRNDARSPAASSPADSAPESDCAGAVHVCASGCERRGRRAR